MQLYFPTQACIHTKHKLPVSVKIKELPFSIMLKGMWSHSARSNDISLHPQKFRKLWWRWWLRLNLTCWWYNYSLAGFSITFLVGGKSFGKGGEGKNVKRRHNLAPVSGKYWNLGHLECIFSILEQKLECLNRTQTSLNFGFFLFGDSTWILYLNWGNIQRK